jgi:hypothetical protein
MSRRLIAAGPDSVMASTAAVEGVPTDWHDQLLPRTALQVDFLAATLAVAIHPQVHPQPVDDSNTRSITAPQSL